MAGEVVQPGMTVEEVLQVVLDRLHTLNNLYGVGTLERVEFDDGFKGIRGTMLCTRRHGFLDVRRKFRVEGNVLYSCGHQTTLTHPYRY